MASAAGFSHTSKEVEKIDTKYRSIKTALPVPESVPLLQKMYSLEAQAMHGQYLINGAIFGLILPVLYSLLMQDIVIRVLLRGLKIY